MTLRRLLARAGLAAPLLLSLAACATPCAGPCEPRAWAPPPPEARRTAPLEAAVLAEAPRAERPAADEVRVVRETDGTAFVVYPGGEVRKLHGPQRGFLVGTTWTSAAPAEPVSCDGPACGATSGGPSAR
jgi:hypothetical protein